ncbi:hypothetical protein DPMN_011706 [Dreissena polymorpha]|uniref:MAM domain-containing protein n=1 Tax=Dreissena polymorpha TaxID=45954 RepID=A0A9D4N128_DREPO|nr:hypothetical protein DPMN_011706 [Dreissena polymorpha]
MCTWTQDRSDNFDWTRAQSPTGTQVTGPIVDHTLGTSKHLLSLQSNEPLSVKTRLEEMSPKIILVRDKSGPGRCLIFTST